MSGSDRFKRSFLLWLGVGCAGLSHWFLLWIARYQTQQAENLSDRHHFHFNSAEPYSSHSIDSDAEEARGQNAEGREHLRESSSCQQGQDGAFPPLQLSAQKLRLVVLLFTKIRNASLTLLFASLIGNELSHVYFSGHTVLSSLLSFFAKQLEPTNSVVYAIDPCSCLSPLICSTGRHRFALRLLEVGLWWDRFWLSPSNALLCDNYKDLALLSAIMKSSDHYKMYSRFLAELKFVCFLVIIHPVEALLTR